MSPEIKHINILNWEALSIMKGFLQNNKSHFFSVMDASGIVSTEQVMMAFEKASRIFSSSTKYRRPESVFLMLLSGETQITRAQDAIGLSSSTSSALVVYEAQQDLEKFLEECGSMISLSNEIPLPDRSLTDDGEVFSRMARVQLAL